MHEHELPSNVCWCFSESQNFSSLQRVTIYTLGANFLQFPDTPMTYSNASPPILPSR